MSHCSYNPCSIWIENPDVQADTFFSLGNAISGTVLALQSTPIQEAQALFKKASLRMSGSQTIRGKFFPTGLHIHRGYGWSTSQLCNTVIKRYLNFKTIGEQVGAQHNNVL